MCIIDTSYIINQLSLSKEHINLYKGKYIFYALNNHYEDLMIYNIITYCAYVNSNKYKGNVSCIHLFRILVDPKSNKIRFDMIISSY